MQVRCWRAIVAATALLAVAALLGVLPSAASAGEGPGAGPAESTGPSAAAGRLHLDRPRVRGDRVRLSGERAAARARVAVQRRLDGRWSVTRRTRADARGAFVATVRLDAGERARLRVRSAGLASKPVTVRAQGESTPPVTDECGRRLLKADGTAWECTFHDDFSGTTLDRERWHVQVAPGSSTHSCSVDDPRVVAVQGGRLRLRVRPAKGTLVCPEPLLGGARAAYVGGEVNTYWKFSQRYGRFAARIRSAKADGPGLQEAFWLWPDARYITDLVWPAAGEIDIAETYSAYPDLSIPFLHYTENDNGGPIPGTNTAWDCAAQRGRFNTYALEWTAHRLELLVNGRTCLVNTSGDQAFRQHFIMALTAMMDPTQAASARAGLDLPATMQVDWVRVWR